MRHTYDEDKQIKVLHKHELDLADAWWVFEGVHFSQPDYEHSGSEERIKTIGTVRDGTVVLVVWAKKPGERRIITMWVCNEKARRGYLDKRERIRRRSSRN